MRRLCFIVILFELCLACKGPSTANYIHNMRAWVGQSPQTLISEWGEPTQIINTRQGQKIIYQVERQIPLPGNTSPSPANPLGYENLLEYTPANQTTTFCQTTFYTHNDRIENWSFQGNACQAD